MAKIGMKSLATAAMLASAIPAGAQAPESYAQAQISEVLTNEENVDGQNTLFFGEVKIRSQIEEKLNFNKLVKFYGEDEVKSRIDKMVDEICESPDKYGTFNSKGDFIFKLTKEEGYSLCMRMFPECEVERVKDILMPVIYVLWILGIFCTIKMNKLDTELEDWKKRYDALQERYDELNEKLDR